ncbi:MAG: hypothetical protein AAGC57_14575 [Pseudomonadota bacterium]
MIWAPVMAYLGHAPLRYTSSFSLILPGAGGQVSVNLSGIGQASSAAASPFMGTQVSPTVTYKRLMGADRIVLAAAKRSGADRRVFGTPRIKLVDETSLILVEMTGDRPDDAQAFSTALLSSFLAELDRLRADEVERREVSARSTIAEYEAEVGSIRDQITELQLSSGLVSVDHYDDLVAGAATLEQKVKDTEAAMRRLAIQVESMHAALGIDAERAAMTLRLQADTEYQMLAKTMGTYAAKLAAARGKYGERHPDLIAIRDAHRGAKARLYPRAIEVTGYSRPEIDRWIDMDPSGERGTLLAGLVTKTADRDGLAAEHASLVRALKDHRARATNLIAATARLDDLNRDYQIAEAVFSSALARTDTGRADIYASYPLVQILEDPSLPEAPSSPKRLLAVAAGVGASLCLAVALLLAWVRRPIIDRLAGMTASAEQ